MGAWWAVKRGILVTGPHGPNRNFSRKRLVTAPLPGCAVAFLDGSEQYRSGTQPHDQTRAHLLPVSPCSGLPRVTHVPVRVKRAKGAFDTA